MHYHYCPTCGTKLVDRPAGDDGVVPYCTHCETYWFDSFASCVIVLIATEEGEMAMLRQNYLSPDFWTYVAGYLTPGENAEEAAVREVKEELGFDIKRLIYGGTYWYAEREQLMHGFIGIVDKADFELSQEIDEAVWVSVTDAPTMMFPDKPGNSQRPLYNRLLRVLDEQALKGAAPLETINR